MFDSGVGGLSVLAEVRRIMPNEDVLYVADQAWVPYGERALDEVRGRVVDIARRLIESGAEAVVVACNSASAAALHHLRETFPETPFVGMEPAVKPAALESRTGVVGVLATRATFQGELFASVVDRHANGAVVIAEPAQRLVAWVESGADDGSGAGELDRIVGSMIERGVDTIVLGCTHYSFLRPEIASVAGNSVSIIDPAPAVARQVERVLSADRTDRPADEPGSIDYRTTGDPAGFHEAITRLLGEPPATAPSRW